MEQLHRIIQEQFGVELRDIPGTGAAGGISGMLLATLAHAQLKSGAQVVAEATCLEESIKWADLVVTGEGSYDSQTAQGKLVHQVQRLCAKNGKSRPIIVCGRVDVLSSHEEVVFDLVSRFGVFQAMTNTISLLSDLAASDLASLILSPKL